MKLQRVVAPLLLSISIPLSGCGSDPGPFNPKRLAQIQKDHAYDEIKRPMDPLPVKLEPSDTGKENGYRPLPLSHIQGTTQPYRPEAPMTLEEVIQRTVLNSLEVRVAGYQAAIDAVRILEAESHFDPLIFINGQIQKTFPQGGVVPGNLNPDSLITQTLQAGLRQPLTTGGTLELSQQFERFGEGTTGSVLGGGTVPRPPFYQDDLVLKLNQPILRDFGEAANLARIIISRNDHKISQLDFREKLETNVQKVEELYWQLVEAKREVVIQERLIRETQEGLDTVIKRQIQDATPLAVSQTRADLEQRNASLIRLRARVQDFSDQIKAVMNDPDLPSSGPVVIVPLDDPTETPIQYDISDQIETAMQNRLELAQQSLRIDSARIVIGAARNNMLPKLDLILQGGIQGFGNDFNDALRSESNTDFLTYGVGFQFEVPIGNRQARAIYQRTLLQHQQAIDQYRFQAEQVASQVRIAQRDVQTSWEEVGATRRARYAARQVLDLILAQERAGKAPTPEFQEVKLARQASLAQAAISEATALARYNIAITALEKTKGTLLRYNNVMMKEQAGPMMAKIERAAGK